MRKLLAQMRNEGFDFEFSYSAALRKIRWPHDKQNRQEWKTVLAQMVEVWEDAYYMRGSHIELEPLVAEIPVPHHRH